MVNSNVFFFFCWCAQTFALWLQTTIYCVCPYCDGTYMYVEELWRKKHSDTLRFFFHIRSWEYRQLHNIVHITCLTRPDKTLPFLATTTCIMRTTYFYTPDFDNSNNSKVVSHKKKREYGSSNNNKESLSLQE